MILSLIKSSFIILFWRYFPSDKGQSAETIRANYLYRRVNKNWNHLISELLPLCSSMVFIFGMQRFGLLTYLANALTMRTLKISDKIRELCIANIKRATWSDYYIAPLRCWLIAFLVNISSYIPIAFRWLTHFLFLSFGFISKGSMDAKCCHCCCGS